MPIQHPAGPRCAVLALLVVAPWALAEDRADPAFPARIAVEAVPAALEVPFKPVSELGRTLDPGRLADLRGGDGGQTENLIDVDGSVDGNTAHHIASGSNSIADGAFTNASGINTVIQNTGSNVLIQNATIVTVDFAGGPP